MQKDATQSLETLAAALDVSQNTCWRRVKALEARGVIKKRVAIVAPDKVGLAQTVFVTIQTNTHSKQWLSDFAEIVGTIPEIVGFYRMAGDVDYLLKITCGSVADYDRVYKKLIDRIEIANVSASFAMECLKDTTELPL